MEKVLDIGEKEMEPWGSESELWEFGDRFEETPRGKLYIHVPEVQDIRRDLVETGFSVKVIS